MVMHCVSTWQWAILYATTAHVRRALREYTAVSYTVCHYTTRSSCTAWVYGSELYCMPLEHTFVRHCVSTYSSELYATTAHVRHALRKYVAVSYMLLQHAFVMHCVSTWQWAICHYSTRSSCTAWVRVSELYATTARVRVDYIVEFVHFFCCAHKCIHQNYGVYGIIDVVQAYKCPLETTILLKFWPPAAGSPDKKNKLLRKLIC